MLYAFPNCGTFPNWWYVFLTNIVERIILKCKKTKYMAFTGKLPVRSAKKIAENKIVEQACHTLLLVMNGVILKITNRKDINYVRNNTKDT